VQVTVVDCSTFLTHLDSITNLEQLGMATGKDDTRPLAFLLAEQVQFANRILVNKTDLVSPEEVNKVRKLTHASFWEPFLYKNNHFAKTGSGQS
jgi:G3E family GTPase